MNKRSRILKKYIQEPQIKHMFIIYIIKEMLKTSILLVVANDLCFLTDTRMQAQLSL